ncbi:hypothetical protein ABLE68_17820 [Nocardioides sp. CN2-186]|uniref:hypothetical protein n=1 Tax=Nocardioides tweenelious TaxID=3156607 RepID=UPI0032B5FBD7
MKTAAVVVLLVLLTGCSGDESPPEPTAPVTSTTASPAGSPAASPKQVMRDPHARLIATSAALRHGRVQVTAAWQAGSRRTIVSSDDRMATVTYRRWTAARARAAFSVPVDPEPGVLAGLIAQPVATVGGTGEALVGGGDGATLLPFEAAARLDGTRWRRFAVPRVSGEVAYVDGAVVLPDGRLLVLLDHWSGDRGQHLSTPHHGLWISAGDDWGSYAPYRPLFAPSRAEIGERALPMTELGGTSGRSGVVWVRSGDAFYVSRDGRVFRQEPTRPLL